MSHAAQGNTSRRIFLQNSLTGLAAVSASGLAKRAYAAGSDEIKIGLVGCGGRGTGAAMDAMRADEGVRLVAMSDVFEDRVQASLDEIKGNLPDQVAVDKDHCFVGLDGYQKVIDSGVDAVLIACASKFHPLYAKTAIEAGKHVFVEKPHGIDPPGIRLMKEACEAAHAKNLSLVSGLMNRYVPGVQETMKRVQDGAIGEIVAIEENFLRAPYVLVARQPGDRELDYQFRNWYHFSWLSGDDVTQSLVHSLDKAMWAMQEKPPQRAHGLAGRSASFGDIYGDVFDHHAVVYEYDSGVKIYAFCRTQNDCHGGVSDIIMGTKGRCDLLNNTLTGETNWKYEGSHDSGYIREHQALFQGIRNGRPVVSDYMIGSTMIAVLGQMACYSGRQVSWEDACRSNYVFGPEAASWDMEPPKQPGPDGNYPIAVPGKTQVL